MILSSNGNIFRVTGPLCGEFTGHRWIPLTKASDAELWCIWSAPEQTLEQTIESLVIWDVIALIMASPWWCGDELDHFDTQSTLSRRRIFQNQSLFRELRSRFTLVYAFVLWFGTSQLPPYRMIVPLIDNVHMRHRVWSWSCVHAHRNWNVYEINHAFMPTGIVTSWCMMVNLHTVVMLSHIWYHRCAMGKM